MSGARAGFAGDAETSLLGCVKVRGRQGERGDVSLRFVKFSKNRTGGPHRESGFDFRPKHRVLLQGTGASGLDFRTLR